MVADNAGQHPGVDLADSGNAIFLQQVVYAVFSTPVAWHFLMAAHNKAVYKRTHRFEIIAGDAVVSDQRICHGNDLSTIRRVRQHLLITCNPCVKYNLACHFAFSAKCGACKKRSVLKQQSRLHSLPLLLVSVV
ncbi:hypothetical protein D3C75_878820 [compost metagenome]